MRDYCALEHSTDPYAANLLAPWRRAPSSPHVYLLFRPTAEVSVIDRSWTGSSQMFDGDSSLETRQIVRR